MKMSIRIAEVYSELLNESKKELVVVKDHKTYVGALFFKKDFDETVKKVYEREDVDGTALENLLTAYRLMKKHNLIAKDNKTFKTMLHWANINGVIKEYIDGQYGCKNDTELFNLIECRA